MKRKVWDSNPRWLSPRRVSNPVHSASLPTFQMVDVPGPEARKLLPFRAGMFVTFSRVTIPVVPNLIQGILYVQALGGIRTRANPLRNRALCPLSYKGVLRSGPCGNRTHVSGIRIALLSSSFGTGLARLHHSVYVRERHRAEARLIHHLV